MSKRKWWQFWKPKSVVYRATVGDEPRWNAPSKTENKIANIPYRQPFNGENK